MKKPQISAPSWLTGKADAASLPALAELLAGQIDLTTVDELWLVPTRRAAGVESTVFVLSVHDHEDLRRVLTAHMRVTRDKKGQPTIETKLDEHATAPAERIPRVIDGVLKRLSDDYSSTPPSTARINCSTERWSSMVEALMNVKPNETIPERLIPDEEEAE